MFSKKLPIILLVLFIAVAATAGFLYSKLNLFNQPRPGYCKILQAKYCKKAVAVIHPLAQNGEKILVFNLPPGIPIFSPEDGYISKPSYFTFEKDENSSLYSGATLFISPSYDTKLATSSFGFAGFDNISITDRPEKLSQIKKGEIIGYVSDKKMEMLGDNNFAIISTKYGVEQNNQKSYTNDFETLSKMFRLK